MLPFGDKCHRVMLGERRKFVFKARSVDDLHLEMAGTYHVDVYLKRQNWERCY